MIVSMSAFVTTWFTPALDTNNASLALTLSANDRYLHSRIIQEGVSAVIVNCLMVV